MQIREKLANYFIWIISITGWLFFLFQLKDFTLPSNGLILLVLILFLYVTEYFPMPVWKGNSSFSFLLLYVIDIIYGLSTTLLALAFISLVVYTLQKLPIRALFFNPAQLILSFGIAEGLTSHLLQLNYFTSISSFYTGMVYLLFLTFFYFIANNIIVDLVLIIRPQPYSLKRWGHKTGTELLATCFMFLYGALMLFLGGQDRGVIDVFSFFFFFSPLVGISVLSSIIVKLQKEKNRLKVLFRITNKLNNGIALEQNFKNIKHLLQGFLDYDTCYLFIKEPDHWKLIYQDGYANVKIGETCPSGTFNSITSVMVYANRKKEKGPIDAWFPNAIKAYAYSPLQVEGETIGLLVIGKTRTESFRLEGVQPLVTLSNQLAIAMKMRALVIEQERSKILEERNRIAREIHDGVAQTLAGAIMNLEIAAKKFKHKPNETMKLLDNSVYKLRTGLKEIRESIYALRPIPTDHSGLKHAIVKKIEILRQETSIAFIYEERGHPEKLSKMVEKVMYEILQECLHNAVKHAKATKVDILLSYQRKHILLKVSDNGVGFSLLEAMMKAKKEPHFGILNMNDLAEKLGASLQIDSKPGKGTVVCFTIPKLEEATNGDQCNVSG
jgi:signal transduction histidine kinase